MLILGVLLLLASIPLASLYMVAVLYKNPPQFPKALPLYIITMALIAYCCNPNYENDLVRYFMMIDNCRMMPFSVAFTWMDDGLVVKNFLFWIIGKSGDNHLLPALTIGILYGVSAYLAIDSFKAIGSLRKLGWLISFQLLILPFFEALSNNRNMMAFALIILAAYRDIVKKKRNIVTILLYILPCFIHMTGFVLVLIRLATIVMKRYPLFTVVAAVAIPTICINAYGTFYSLASNIPGAVGKIVQRAIQKAYSSSTNTSYYAQSMRDSGYNNACRIVILLAFLMLAYLLICYIRRKRTEDANFSVFCLLLCDITIVWILIQTAKYWVFAVATIVSSAQVLAFYVTHYKECKKAEKFCISGIKMLAFIRFALELYYMSSRLEISAFFTNVLFVNIYTVIGKLLVNIMVG